ncbi:hypothetical protein HanRHA438_Chr03g0112961 [Helianthus annuus]|nr:hypothetical protein HanRHA438_Chr03g0112961 [Helianthus annuus]
MSQPSSPIYPGTGGRETSFGGIGVYHFGSGNYFRIVVRKYFTRVKYHTFIILNTLENPTF